MKGRIRIAIACAGLLATSAAQVRAQTTFRETGSVTVGGYFVWVRGTSANVVELFVGHGFRDAFARAHEMDAARLQHWIDSIRTISPLPPGDSSAVDADARGSMVGSDVSMMRRVGGPFSGLRLLVTGEESITMAEPTALEFIAALDSAAHVARALSPIAATPSIPATALAETPAAPLGPSTAEAPPELVLPRPSEPVILLASRVDIMPLPLPTPVVPAPVAPAEPLASEPVAATPVASAPDSVIRPNIEAPADKLIHTPLGPFTVPGALLADRDKEVQYCYTQLGLRYNPDLKGEISVKVSVGNDGSVLDAVVEKRSWQGISAGEVGVVRARARARLDLRRERSRRRRRREGADLPLRPLRRARGNPRETPCPQSS